MKPESTNTVKNIDMQSKRKVLTITRKMANILKDLAPDYVVTDLDLRRFLAKKYNYETEDITIPPQFEETGRSIGI